MTLIERLKTLTREQEKEIFEAFNECLEYVISFDDGTILAVHLKNAESFDIKEKRGDWFYGTKR